MKMCSTINIPKSIKSFQIYITVNDSTIWPPEIVYFTEGKGLSIYYELSSDVYNKRRFVIAARWNYILFKAQFMAL